MNFTNILNILFNSNQTIPNKTEINHSSAQCLVQAGSTTNASFH